MLLFIRRCELHTVALTKRPLHFSVQRYTMQSARIVTHLLAVSAFHRHLIFFFVHTFDSCVLPRFDTVRLAPLRVVHHVASFVLVGPLPYRSCAFLAIFYYLVFL